MSQATKLFLALLLLPLTLCAQTPVNTDAPTRAVTLTLAPGTLDAIHVYTQGSEKFDFALAPGGTCAVGQTYLAGQTCTVNLAFHPLYPGERRGAIVLLPRSGPPLAQALVSAQAVGSVNTFLPGTITTVAGDQNWIFAGDGMPATQTNIFLPFGLAVDAAGDLFLADSSNNRIRKVDAATGLVSTIAGTGNIGATGDNGPATLAALSNPSSIALDPAGNIFFADSGNNAIRRVDAVTGIITTVAGTLNHHGYTGDNAPAAGATLNTPNGIALDASGNLYLADTGNHVIRRVDAVSGLITTVAGTGTAGFNGDSRAATQAQLSSPWSVTIAPTGELYIADQNNHRIRKVSLAGSISTVAGTGAEGFSGDKGPASQAQLNEPASVALDVAGNLYLADSGNNRIRKISAKDATITTIAGVDGESFTGDTGPADQAGLYGPYTLALDGADNLFIADVFHNRVRKIAAGAASLKFPAIRVGRVSDPQTQTVENDGNAPLHFTSLAPVSNAQLDPASTVCSTAAPLAPLATCVTGVAFAPTLTGDPVTGSLALNSDAGNAPGVISVSGTVLDIDPTTLALSASANPALTGATIVFKVAATSAGATPTGTVTLTDVFGQATTVLGTVTLAGGNAALSVSTLIAGPHSVTAAYSGDSSNAAANSTPLLELVKEAQAPTVISLTSSANPIDAGASLTLTATVATKTEGAGSFAIAGSITLLDGTRTIGTATLDPATATLDHATATFSLNTLAVGTHALTAVYAGTANDTPSTSAVVQQVVRLATTTLGLTTSSSPAPSGAPFTLTAHATGTGGTPTGAVSYFANGLPIGTATLNGQGIASLPLTSAWQPGTYTLTASYAGDAADTPAMSLPVTQEVVLASSSLTLASSLNPAGMGAQVVFTVHAASNGATPTGTITFLEGTTVLGTSALDATGIAAIATSTLAVGTHTITATYVGDQYCSSAASTPLHQVVQATTIGIALTSSKTPALFADTITLTAAVTGSGSTPVGSVTFFDGPSRLGMAALDASGHAAFTTSTMTIGDHALTATYGGDVNHAPVTSTPLAEQVLQATALVLQFSTVHTIAGLPLTLRATVSGTSSQPNAPQPTGTITLTDGAARLAALTPDAAGLVTYTTSLAVGQHSLAASYTGDHNNAPSNAPPVALQVELATTTTTLTATPSPAAFGAQVTLTAAVTGNGGVPPGSITFKDGIATLSIVPVSANGTAALTLTTLAPGIHALTAIYSGDANDQPSQSPPTQEQVALHSTLALTASANPALLGDPVTLTLVAANGSVTVPAGIVNVTDNGVALPPVTLVNGAAGITLQAPALGTHTVLASYAGDASNGPATAQPLALTITLRPSATSLAASSSALAAGQQLILIAIVQASGARAPTGTVSFQAGSNVLGTVAISPAGVATLTITPPSGAVSVTAQYLGDTLYAPSTSIAIAISVGPPNPFTLTATPPSLRLQSGRHADVKVAIASNPNFHDTLALGCAGLPAYATCTFSNDRLAVTPGLPQSFTVTVDTGNPLGAGAAAAALPLGGLLLLAFGRRRRYWRALALATVLAMAAIGSTGCATQFAQSTTPAGTYSFQIVGTGVASGATENVTIQLAVSK